MFDLELEPWIPGDIATIAAWENDQESKVRDMIDYFRDHRWTYITSEDVTKAIHRFGIDYPYLPQWLKDVIDDEIEII